jgi:hypothetical protein
MGELRLPFFCDKSFECREVEMTRGGDDENTSS